MWYIDQLIPSFQENLLIFYEIAQYQNYFINVVRYDESQIAWY